MTLVQANVDVNMTNLFLLRLYYNYITYSMEANLITSNSVSPANRFQQWKIYSHRLLPNGTDNNISKAGVRYYRKVIKELQNANITPVVTLFHWDLPTPLMDLGGWANPIMVNYFRDYARVVFNLFGDVVKIWTTMNEPHQHCYNVSLPLT